MQIELNSKALTMIVLAIGFLATMVAAGSWLAQTLADMR